MSISAPETVKSGLQAMMPGSADTTTTPGGSADKEMFLQLLVAQLKYQDPMNPTDTSEFLSQSAQFTSLEKMQEVADKTGALATAQMAFGASSLVGREVSYSLADGSSGTGTVSAVAFEADGPMLSVGGTSVPLGQVLSVTNSLTSGTAGTTPGSTASATPSTTAANPSV